MNWLKWLLHSDYKQRPTLDDKLEELADKYGKLTETKFINGKVHYFFSDGTQVYFTSTLTGMQLVYVAKGYLYDVHNY